MPEQPFFSVLMPAFNAARHIRKALGDLLRQTERDFEIVVVDDGSSDETSLVVDGFRDARVRLLRLQSNIGLVGALNAGLAECRGRWVARQDADDRCGRDRLACQRAAIVENPDAVLFYSWARLINGRGIWRGRQRTPIDDAQLRWDLGFRNGIVHTSVVFSRQEVEHLGGYGGDNVTADYDLWSRLLRVGRGVGDRRSLVCYRNHSGSIMGRENAGNVRSSDGGVAELMRRNLRDWAKASDDEAGRIVHAWLQPGGADWLSFVRTTNSLRGRALEPSAATLSELDYTLLHRCLGVSREVAADFLRALKAVDPERFRSLPKIRTSLSLLLKA